MGKIRGINQIRMELEGLRSSGNLAHLMALAKIFRGRQLFVTLGSERVADLQGLKGLREALEGREIPLSDARKAFETVAIFWLEEPFTGGVDLEKVIKAPPSNRDELVRLSQQKDVPPQSEVVAPVPIISPPSQLLPSTSPTAPPAISQMTEQELLERLDSLKARDQSLEVRRERVEIQLWLAWLNHKKRSEYFEGKALGRAASQQMKIAEETGALKDYRAAIKYYDHAIRVLKKYGRGRERLAAVLIAATVGQADLAKRTEIIDDWQKVIGYAAEAAAVYRELGNELSLAYCLSYEGRAHFSIAEKKNEIKEFQRAISCYQAALAGFSAFKVVEKEAFAVSYTGSAHLRVAELSAEFTKIAFEEAIELIRKSVELFKGAKKFKDAAYGLGNMGRAYLRIAEGASDPEAAKKSIGICRESLEIFKGVGAERACLAQNYEIMARANKVIAIAMLEAGDRRNGLAYLEQARDLGIEAAQIFEELNEKGKAAYCRSFAAGRQKRIAILTGRLDDFNTALSFAEQARELFERTGNRERREGEEERIRKIKDEIQELG